MKISALWYTALFFTIGIVVGFGGDLYVDYSANPSPRALRENKVCILHPGCKSPLKEGQKLGNQYYAYLSIAEVSSSASYFEKLRSNGITFAGENADWGSRLIDVRQEKWEEFFVETLARQIVDLGFDGFFIDTIDSIQLLDAGADRSLYREYEESVIRILGSLRRSFPGKKIIANRGFDLLPRLQKTIDGVLVESVFSSSDIEGTKTVIVDEATTGILVGQIHRARQLGFKTYVLDYVSPGDREVAIETDAKIRKLGSAGYVAPRTLDGVDVREKRVFRKIMVIYGFDPEEAEAYPVFPGDTLSLAMIQTSLEWMGYEFEYHNISNGLPKAWNSSDFCGVIFDESLIVPRAIEIPLAKWMLERISEKKKVLFLGTGDFSNETARDMIFAPLGVTFEGFVPKESGEVTVRKVDQEMMNFEIKTEASKEGFMALQAPDEADLLVSLEMKADKGEIVRFDPVFLTEWGGCLLTPYGNFQVSAEISLSHTDPFNFLSRIWPAGEFPVPDVTTKQGLRIFYTHIDGDGFVSVANFPGHPICGEVLHDKVLKDARFPITVSIVEAEIRGHMLSQVNPDVRLHERIAQKIFKLPHVEPASHSYSHPYVWNPDDKSYYSLYKTLNLPLKLTTRYPKISLEREIGASLSYIGNKLSGVNNPPKIFLWSGNCRPSAEALRLVREAGAVNMNGGNTILSKRFPGISAVAPKLISSEGEMQIFASNQNEYYYTEGWKGPFFNGFKMVIETFEMTEAPRRLKPVNVYYHFYSGERYDALLALQQIYEWCEAQELHLMTAGQYARMVHDSFHTDISELERNRWIIRNAGLQQTFRIPAERGFPDLDRSQGVIGFRKFQDSWYVATDGSDEVVLALGEKEKRQPHLSSSTEPVSVTGMSGEGLSFRNDNLQRDSEIFIGGLDSGKWDVSIQGEDVRSVEPENFSISFTVPPGKSGTIGKGEKLTLPLSQKE